MIVPEKIYLSLRSFDTLFKFISNLDVPKVFICFLTKANHTVSLQLEIETDFFVVFALLSLVQLTPFFFLLFLSFHIHSHSGIAINVIIKGNNNVGSV